MRVTALAGGTGAAKLIRGLAAAPGVTELTIVVNTGDDTVVWGLHVETFHCLDAMAALGAETWFNLGDRDLATHVFRTARLGSGASLSTVTAELAQLQHVSARILPMSDDAVRTHV